MGVSIKDICLTVISNGETAYYSSVKGIGNLLFDTKVGLYSAKPPKASELFKRVKDENWLDCIEKLDKPLKSPIYGTIKVDFDSKKITSKKGYGVPNEIMVSFMLPTIEHTLGIGRREGLISDQAIKNHFKNKRFKHTDSNYQVIKDIPEFETLQDYYEFLSNSRYDIKSLISFVSIELPKGWTLEDKNK